LKVIKALLKVKYEEIAVDIVIGPANPNTRLLQRKIQSARKRGQSTKKVMRLHRGGNMPELMARADIAVSAGGSTCWELCFFGKPFLTIIAADNQRDIALGLDQAGVATCLGWHYEVTEQEILVNLEDLLSDPRRRRDMSANGRRLVDGYGRLRVLQALADNSR
jgi:spore coat polysaccharide biosynthesis predicted glycosyltransferase SpsG